MRERNQLEFQTQLLSLSIHLWLLKSFLRRLVNSRNLIGEYYWGIGFNRKIWSKKESFIVQKSWMMKKRRSPFCVSNVIVQHCRVHEIPFYVHQSSSSFQNSKWSDQKCIKTKPTIILPVQNFQKKKSNQSFCVCTKK